MNSRSEHVNGEGDREIWILNHYVAGQFLERSGRHYWFARKLVERGHRVRVLTASTVHGASQTKQVRGRHVLDGVDYTFVRTPRYRNRRQRAVNMLVFFVSLLVQGFRARRRPDVIYASSVHPLTLLAGILLGRRFGVPVICEVRDLWPLSIEVYEPSLEGSLLTRALYRLERWLYRHADQLIFTMEGGAQYIRDKGWDREIDLTKVHHINNGIDLGAFDACATGRELDDPDLADPDVFTVVYAGSIRLVNRVDLLVDVARELHARGVDDVRILIYGHGDKVDEVARAAEGLPTIAIRGRIPGALVPELLTRADALILHGDQGLVAQYGTSMNKLFEYLASGRPILSDCRFEFDPIECASAGIIVPGGTPSDLADSILSLQRMPAAERAAMGERARRAGEEYDFEILTDRLESILLGVDTELSSSEHVERVA